MHMINTLNNNDYWKKELKKCSLDRTRAYMISNYIFKRPLWRGQKELLDVMIKRDVTLSIKSRCVGYTCLMAAFTACEMVLNYDIKRFNGETHIVYIAPSGDMRSSFMNKVCEYIEMLPKELWVTTEDPKLIELYRRNFKYLKLGEIQLMVTEAGNTGFSNSNSKRPSYTIYDEMVTLNNEFDFNSPYEKNWRDISEKVIIGGNPNHNNEFFYEFAKDYKEKYRHIVKMPFEDNPNNKWHKISTWDRMYSETHEFADEYKCEIFKLVKEKL